MNGLETKHNLTPASFIDKQEVRLTTQQKALLILLKDKIGKNEAISREDMVDFYIKHVKGGDEYVEKWVYDYNVKHYVELQNPITHRWSSYWNIKSLSRMWFQSNLGAVIIKGKVLVIPIIEAD